jgi:hypothetical protein
MRRVSLHDRLGVDVQVVDRFGLLQSAVLPDPKELFDAALEVAPSDPDGAKGLLAAALLSTAERSDEARLMAALPLIAQLVARTDPKMTLGRSGEVVRTHAMPNGWRYMSESYERVRYAWRNGLRELLTDDPALSAIKVALDEVTRLYPGEPEPTRVVIQEQWPSARAAGLISIASLMLSAWAVRDSLPGLSKKKSPPKRRRT